jgi:NAD(P)-dependent dehydrogenase (short-subunit alcohol dehydrogenase family)
MDRLRLSGKTALVTGGGSGLGQAMAMAMADAGADIAVAGRRREPLAETARLVDPDEAGQDRRGNAQPIGRLGVTCAIGPLAVFLASDAADYTSGETVLIDGGAIAGGVLPAGVAPLAEG